MNANINSYNADIVVVVIKTVTSGLRSTHRLITGTTHIPSPVQQFHNFNKLINRILLINP